MERNPSRVQAPADFLERPSGETPSRPEQPELGNPAHSDLYAAHKAEAPALTVTEAEDFFSSGDQAWPKGSGSEPGSANVFLKNPARTCCQGVDQPGIGYEHAADCPNEGRNRAAVPEPSYRAAAQSIGREVRELIAELDAALVEDPEADRRERLLTKLLFAALGLAERNLRSGVVLGEYKGEQILSAGCAECLASEILGHLEHKKACCTGEVLGILAQLAKTQDPTSNEKDDAPERAGPRGLTERVCLKCGRSDGEWRAERRYRNGINLSLVGLNQLIQRDVDGADLLHTHHCESKLRGVDVLFGGAQ